MTPLSVLDALDLMQSDMKLWDHAEKEIVGEGRMALTLNLPWGIGQHTVTLEGLSNAQGKRNAVGAYGEHIRAVIKERIDDEAVTARARQAAARREPVDSTDSTSSSGAEPVQDQQAVQAETVQEAGQAYSQTSHTLVGSREALVAERTAVENRIGNIERTLKGLHRELRVIDAALSAWGDDEE